MEVYHVSTISDTTITITYKLLRNVNDYSYTHHARQQKDTKGVSHWSNILANGKLIELKIDKENKHHRALLRTEEGHCAVFCWKNKKVITTWWNDPNDKHFTINPNQYIRGVKNLV